jgi:hypothetical protein
VELYLHSQYAFRDSTGTTLHLFLTQWYQ